MNQSLPSVDNDVFVWCKAASPLVQSHAIHHFTNWRYTAASLPSALNPLIIIIIIIIIIIYTGPPRGGVAGASAPGPGGPKGARRAPSKKIKLV